MAIATATVGSYIERSAVFSENRKHRHILERWWSLKHGRFVTFILLNPSKASAEIDDPTVRNLIAFANAWGYDGLKLVNLYDYIATYPEHLLKAVRARRAISGDCDKYIREAIKGADKVVAAWGAHANPLRADRVRGLCSEVLTPLWVFGFNKDGSPRHPGRLAHSTGLRIWRALA